VGLREVKLSECIFCDLVAGRGKFSAFYEDDLVLGLMTIGPVTEGHAMIIPKKHAAYLADLDEATGRHLWVVTQRTAAALRQCGVKCEGVNLFLADGEAAFQEVLHVHMHVFPRYRGDPFKLVADWSIKPTRAELDRVAAMIRDAYDRLWKGAPPTAI
jgi:histidine triad (HIT) family protein